MKDLTITGSKINTKMGKAICEHSLIDAGDRILIGLSGGKDSLTMLEMLYEIRKWAPVSFTLVAAHVVTDINCGYCLTPTQMASMLGQKGIEFFVTENAAENSREAVSCFWCSWNRRKALFSLAEEHNCNKIALGHHKDDIAETVLLNLLYKGEISAMNPKQELFGGELAIIRPMCYVEENMIRSYAQERGIPEKKGECPVGEVSKRAYIKNIIDRIQHKTPGTNIRTNVINGVARIREDYIDLKMCGQKMRGDKDESSPCGV